MGDAQLACLPFLFAPEIGLAEVEGLSRALEEQLA
jgi:hypothetical protein